MSAAPSTGWTLRVAVVDDVEAMRSLEVDAGRRFRDIGMDEIADDDPPAADLLQAHIDNASAWIVIDTDGSPIGYALGSIVDDEGHLDQVSVAERAGRRGVGTALIDRVCAWSREQGAGTVTLTTFRDVSFNGPYYASLGFVEIAEADCGPELLAIRHLEQDLGLDIAPRIAMRKSL